MENFTPYSALAGGALIGASSALLLWLTGRIAGISGILGGLLSLSGGGLAWRVLFLAGLVIGTVLYRVGGGPLTDITITSSTPLLIVGGLLVGFGTALGRGCTSGHGICGLARLSPRSLAATLVFMASAAVTVFVARHLVGS
ncbi:MAG: YeeE/YedE family protein [Rhodospirillaceae bacterium]|jgi:uncharacterized protein|nr:YeeE/YedE family protein [Rhodospirillaceae bacterium]MBT5373103.1 YeeE/YedE family protein [Rhodospirillaceae bacterium]MBT5659431.1 YeeE/YedE family protein [Rhodospirillaceae bacterium]MBT5752467.1 YeeE/YedE family protein [Rhodospirillaceae bacterium]